MKSPIALGSSTKNIGVMLLKNRTSFGAQNAFAERVDGKYRYWTWQELTDAILSFSGFLLSQGYGQESRITLIALNSYKRLVAELSIMASGLVSVPIFVGYPKNRMSELLEFSKSEILIVENTKILLGINPKTLPRLILLLSAEGFETLPKEIRERTLLFDDVLHAATHQKYSLKKQVDAVFESITPDAICLIMYTSGTTGFPKGVELSHMNLMSQQRALELLWKPEPGMRFLCYLPWHHSFGGLFERFFALHSGGCLAIDDSWGKNVDALLKNFAEIKPHIYFSVPKVYQEIVARILGSKEIENIFFHSDLKFVFTAAAPLPLSTSQVFKAKGIPVIEGWGLTETSPCCTLTERSTDRMVGVVGFVLPGVEVRLGEEDEIEVKGPNVMRGYFNQPGATQKVLSQDGWFKTGDVGEITPDGLKIVSRKDLMFKLSNGEKVFPSLIEERLRTFCKFVKYTYVFGKGQPYPYLLIFPNSELLQAASSGKLEEASACSNPCSADDLSSCLGDCIQKLNEKCQARFEQIARAVVVDTELTIEGNELTPSFKLVPSKVEERFRSCIQALEENRLDRLPEGARVVNIPEPTRRKL